MSFSTRCTSCILSMTACSCQNARFLISQANSFQYFAHRNSAELANCRLSSAWDIGHQMRSMQPTYYGRTRKACCLLAVGKLLLTTCSNFGHPDSPLRCLRKWSTQCSHSSASSRRSIIPSRPPTLPPQAIILEVHGGNSPSSQACTNTGVFRHYQSNRKASCSFA